MMPLPRDVAARILDGSPDAVLVCDRTDTVRYWNMAAERVFSFGETEAVGASMRHFAPQLRHLSHHKAHFWHKIRWAPKRQYGKIFSHHKVLAF